MLKITDKKSKKTKFILKDEDEQPVKVEENKPLVVEDDKKDNKEVQENN